MLEKNVTFREKEDMQARLLNINSSEPLRQHLFAILIERAETEVGAPFGVLMVLLKALEHFADNMPSVGLASFQILERRGGDFIDAIIDDEEAREFTKILLEMKLEELPKLKS